jgi:hypothetical protein
MRVIWVLAEYFYSTGLSPESCARLTHLKFNIKAGCDKVSCSRDVREEENSHYPVPCKRIYFSVTSGLTKAENKGIPE